MVKGAGSQRPHPLRYLLDLVSCVIIALITTVGKFYLATLEVSVNRGQRQSGGVRLVGLYSLSEADIGFKSE